MDEIHSGWNSRITNIVHARFQNPIAKSNLMEACDMRVGIILFLNSQVRTVNVTLFAIESASDFIPFAENYRKTMGIMGTSVWAYKVEGKEVRFSLHWRTLHVNTRKGGTSREHGYRFSNLVNQYRLFSRSVKPLSSYKLTHNDRANQSAPDVFPGISNYSNNLRTEIPSRSQHLSYIMFSEFLCSRFSHKYISTILEKLFKDLYIYFWIILVINFYKNNNYKHL